VIGAFIICLGLYLVVWGKNKDYNNTSDRVNEEPLQKAKETAGENCTHEVITIH
ncbi:hypothetical protein RYX36_018871, partial [Vicia faba]